MCDVEGKLKFSKVSFLLMAKMTKLYTCTICKCHLWI